MFTPEILAYISMAFGMIGYLTYIYSLRTGKMKPHAFTWIIWALVMGIGFFAQFSEGAGAGAWVTGMGALMCTIISVFALIRGEKHITLSDWITFIAALSAIPVWYITKNALAAVVIVSFIDAIAYYPTFRKSWNKPDEEPAFNYFIGFFSFGTTLFALENVNLTTALYPYVIMLANGLLVGTLLIRRYKLGKKLWPA